LDKVEVVEVVGPVSQKWTHDPGKRKVPDDGKDTAIALDNKNNWSPSKESMQVKDGWRYA
jgi:hypothetical protein